MKRTRRPGTTNVCALAYNKTNIFVDIVHGPSFVRLCALKVVTFGTFGGIFHGNVTDTVECVQAERSDQNNTMTCEFNDHSFPLTLKRTKGPDFVEVK